MKSTTHPSTQILTVDECLTLLAGTAVGRVGVVVGNRPEIYPVNHIIEEGDVVFRTGSGTKLYSGLGRPVAYQSDGYDADAHEAWSVLVSGTATEVTQLHAILDLMRTPLLPWEPGAKPHVVRIRPKSISGRRFPLPEPDRSIDVPN